MSTRDETQFFVTPKLRSQQLEQTHEPRRVEVSHDPGMSFVLPVPRQMVTGMPKSAVGRDHARPMPLALFAEDTSFLGARLVVCSQTLSYEVDPLEWLRYLGTASGWRVVVARALPGPGGPRYELGALQTVDGQHQVRRTLAIRSGPRLVRVDAAASLRNWPRWHDALWTSLDGFRLGRMRSGPVEELIVRDGPLVRFATPASWDARCTGSPAQGVRWSAQPIRGVQRGALLRVFAHDARTAGDPQKRRSGYSEQVRKGAHVGSETLVPRPDFQSLMPGWCGQWDAAFEAPDGSVGVLCVVQREVEGIAVDYVLTCPAAGSEHIDWLRATRALDVAIATTQTLAPCSAGRTAGFGDAARSEEGE